MIGAPRWLRSSFKTLKHKMQLLSASERARPDFSLSKHHFFR